MEELGLWDLLTLKMEEAILTESSNAGTENIHLLLENFAKTTAELNGWKFEVSSPKTFLITFVDIKNSTGLINNPKNIPKIFKFLEITVRAYNQILGSFTLFKLVGDGILFLTPFSFQKFKEPESVKRFKQLANNYIFYRKLKYNSNTLDFRVVSGIGTLYCINFKTQNGTLKECIGCPISYLVKKSKYVDNFEWFGEITPEKCKKKSFKRRY